MTEDEMALFNTLTLEAKTEEERDKVRAKFLPHMGRCLLSTNRHIKAMEAQVAEDTRRLCDPNQVTQDALNARVEGGLAKTDKPIPSPAPLPGRRKPERLTTSHFSGARCAGKPTRSRAATLAERNART